MPTPRNEETESQFIERCMLDPEAYEDFSDEGQRLAFCYSVWEHRGVEKTATIKTLIRENSRKNKENRL